VYALWCRSLWCLLHELPPLDSLNPELLQLDPDLVVQAGPDAVPEAVVAPLIAKWERLHSEWRAAWRQLMSQVCVFKVFWVLRLQGFGNLRVERQVVPAATRP
jgi:hypothetical protein